MWPFTVGKCFSLGISIFATVKLIKNVNFNKYKYSGYGIGFDASGSFSLSKGTEFGENVIIFGADMSSSVHVDNRLLILGKGPTQWLDDTTLTAEKEYSMNFTEQCKCYDVICNNVVIYNTCRNL